MIMRRITLLIAAIAVAVTCMAQTAAKPSTGILLVHYGTNNDQSRAATVDLLNNRVARAFPQCPVVEAYAAPSVIKALAKRGIRKLTIAEAMDSLRRTGCTRMVVQSTMLLDGLMTDLIKDNAKRMRNSFSEVAQARPLLYSIDDCRSLVSVIARHLSADKSLDADRSQVVLVGHGSASSANAMYSQIDYLLKDEGHATWHVGTIEGYPTLESTLRQLGKAENKKVVLVPLLYIAGNHQREDIDGVWKEALTRAGYTVKVVSEGLGEMPEVQDMIIERITKMINKKNEQ